MNNKELVLKEMFGTNNNYAGYNSICDKLISTGECISTIHASSIFRQGGIHNFVKQEPYEQGIDLIKLTIDKDYIYSSKLFKQHSEYMVETKRGKLDILLKEVEELQNFINEFSI